METFDYKGTDTPSSAGTVKISYYVKQQLRRKETKSARPNAKDHHLTAKN